MNEPLDDALKIIKSYFNALDESIDTLSKMAESRIVNLPSWVQTFREITVFKLDSGGGIVIKVDPKNDFECDVYHELTVGSISDINKKIYPMVLDSPDSSRFPEGYFRQFGDLKIINLKGQLAEPMVDDRILICYGGVKGFQSAFSVDRAKNTALDFWNSTLVPGKSSENYIVQVRNILDSIRSIIKRKAFLERRVHRFINEYGDFLLPSHRKCFYEVPIKLDGELRKADFILEREMGMPAMLIELESPVHKILTKKGDFTAQVNHARQQISEWIGYIDRNPGENANGEMSFLVGDKDRLVIIGRGLEYKSILLNKKFDGTIVWTYEMLIESAVDRLNGNYAAQCKLLGLKELRPF